MTAENPEASLALLVDKLANMLVQREQRLAVAESCTGGWIGKTLTDKSGSTAWFDGGVIAYSNEIKQSLLDVSLHSLTEKGAVSETVALEMVNGALDRLNTDLAIAVTGIAGPQGGTEAKPVGLVWIAWARRDAIPFAREFHFTGDREQVRISTVKAALEGLLRILNN